MECDSRDMFLSWKNKQNVKVGLWKWKCTHIKKWWRPEFLPFFVMPDRRVDFKIQTSVLLCKVFFERLTINLLVTKSEEFWSCDKWNKKFEMVTTIIGWQDKEAKKGNGDFVAGSSSQRLAGASNLEWTPADWRPLKRWIIFSVRSCKC